MACSKPTAPDTPRESEQSAAYLKMQYHHEQDVSYMDLWTNERRLVLIGKTGVGKSASANTILGRTAFKSKSSSKSVTTKCQKAKGTLFGKDVVIVDTPGLFDTKRDKGEIEREVGKCVLATTPGPHAFIVVLQVGRFTKEEQNTLQKCLEIFGEAFHDYAIVLFTRKEDFVRDGLKLHEYTEDIEDEYLRDFLQRCKERCVAFNNYADIKEKDEDVKELFRIIERNLMENNGDCYTNEMYKDAVKEQKERMEQMMKKSQQKQKEEVDKIKAELEAENKKIMETLKEQHQREIEEAKKETKRPGESKEDFENRLFKYFEKCDQMAREREERMRKEFSQKQDHMIMEKLSQHPIMSQAQARQIDIDDCLQEKGIFGHAWDGVRSFGRSIAAVAKPWFG